MTSRRLKAAALRLSRALRNFNDKQLGRLTLSKLLSYLLKFAALTHILLAAFILLMSIFLRFSNPPITGLSVYRSLVSSHDINSHIYTPLRKLPEDFINMAIKAEDYKFFRHTGIDRQSIRLALQLNRKYGSKRYGASTITQQLTRTLFLIPQKIYIRKYIEIVMALCLDMFLDKERILELYLNYVEWGEGVFGASKASMKYFNKAPDKLNREQKAVLITLLSSPIRYDHDSFILRRLLFRRYKRILDVGDMEDFYTRN